MCIVGLLHVCIYTVYVPEEELRVIVNLHVDAGFWVLWVLGAGCWVVVAEPGFSSRMTHALNC